MSSLHPIVCVRYDGVESFLRENGPSLLQEESRNCLMLSLLARVQTGVLDESDALFIGLRQGDRFVGQAVHTGLNKPLLLTPMSGAAVHSLLQFVLNAQVDVRRVHGPTKVASAFSEALAKGMGLALRKDMDQGLYELRKVEWPPSTDGEMVLADQTHLARAFELIVGFVQEIEPENPVPEDDAERIVQRHIKQGTLYLWRDGEGGYVSIAAKVRESTNGSTISLVYTPLGHRGCGHATQLMAHLSQALLNEGKMFCNLFTDLSNPTSNRLYQRIGYVQIATCAVYQVSKTDEFLPFV